MIQARVSMTVSELPSEIRLKYRLPEVAAAMQAGYDQSPKYNKTGHISSGRLRAELGKISNLRALPDGAGVQGRVPLIYAAIQNQGGYIPNRKPVNVSRMKFISKGAVVFTKFAKGFRIRPKHFIWAGLKEVARRTNLVVESTIIKKRVI